MTIVAGFHANTGVVLAADSQEVISDYTKATTKKIHVFHRGSESGAVWRVAIAGAAEDVSYLDLFEAELAERLFDLEHYDYGKMLSIMKAVLHRLHKQHIWPQRDMKCPFQTLIATQCASEPQQPRDYQPVLFETSKSTVIGADGFRSIGVGTHMAKYLEQRFIKDRLMYDCSLDHLGDVLVLMLKEIKKAIVGCDGFTSVALFYKDGRYRWMTTSEVKQVEELSDRLERASMNVLFSLTDPTTTDDTFSAIAKAAGAQIDDLLEKRSKIVSLRKTEIDRLPSYRGSKKQKMIGRFHEI